jgi:hypothetical protein
MQIITVDCGRSSIKFAYNINEVGVFYAKFCKADFNYLKTLGFIVDDRDDIIVSLDGGKNVYIVGNCDKYVTAEKIIHLKDDDIYLSNVDLFVKVAVAACLRKMKKNNEDIILGFNLTFNNNDDVVRKAIREGLEGKSEVIFYNIDGSVRDVIKFNIKKISIVYQGWSSLIYWYVDEKLNTNNLYLKDGLVIDIGYKTVDVSLNRNLVSIKGYSYSLGMGNIYMEVSKNINYKYRLKIKDYDVERYCINNESVLMRNGDNVNFYDLVNEMCNENFNILNNYILDDFNNEIYNYVILTGGGMKFYKDKFVNEYGSLVRYDEKNNIYMNAIGMLRFLRYNIER